jgi:ABC transport system ATP-binding/permease protein
VHLVSVKDLGARVDGRTLFTGATFGLRTGDRVGVVGPNGAGKTTLLEILAGVRPPDDGEVVTRRGLRLSWLPQESDGLDGSAASVVAAADSTARADEAASILDRLGISPEQPTDRLSGGQQRRVALARALLPSVDLLVLDEPTNHLDVDAIDWLERELASRAAAVVMVTHDRYLLERVANRMLDLDPVAHTVTWHEGSYSTLLETRAERAEQRARQSARARSLLRTEVAWLRRQPRARTSKPRFRVEQVEELRRAAAPDGTEAPLQLGTGRRRLGDEVVHLEDVTVRRGDRTVLAEVTLDIGPGERVGVVGPNGAGKTTLLEVLAGLRRPDGGTARIGRTVVAGMYAQQARVPASSETVIDTLHAIASHVPLANSETLPAHRLAERFGFAVPLQRTPVADLSGGERRRLALCHLLLDAPNFVLLDEPTNDLDLDTLAALESHLDGFTGTLVVASHDRYLLDRLTDRVLVVDDARVRERDAVDTAAPSGRTADPRRAATDPTEHADNRARQQARRRRRAAERLVDKLAEERHGVHQRMAEAANDPERLVELQAELERVDDEIARAEEDWLVAASEEEQ